jgi:hypothetical protein
MRPAVRRSACRIAVWVALLIHLAPAGRPAEASCFDRDFASWEHSVDYRRALASETLAPDRVTVNGQAVSTALSEAALVKRLGSEYRVHEGWTARDAERQCQYLDSLARAHSNPMHYYILVDRLHERLSGSFRICEWTVRGVGRLRAFLHRPNESATARVWLLHLVMSPVPETSVAYTRSGSLHVVRRGPPKVEWDTARNRVVIAPTTVSAPMPDGG